MAFNDSINRAIIFPNSSPVLGKVRYSAIHCASHSQSLPLLVGHEPSKRNRNQGYHMNQEDTGKRSVQFIFNLYL